MKNVQFKTIKENVKGEKYYILFKLSIEDREKYCIAVCDEEFSVQGLEEDFTKACEMYELIAREDASAIHLSDVVRDMQTEIFI